MDEKLEVPTCISGGITAAHPSLCMDGATHLIHTTTLGTVRLKATNPDAQKALEGFENAKVLVTVCGYERQSVNCTHMDVYSVELGSDFITKMDALTS